MYSSLEFEPDFVRRGDPMKLTRVIVLIVLVGWSVSAIAQVATEPKLMVEIQSGGTDSPRFSVKNLSTKTLVGCTISVSVSAETRSQTKINWNPLAQTRHVPNGNLQGPLEPGQTLTFNLAHVVGGPLPDRVEVIAGIWSDGETFGQPTWIKVLMEMNASMVSAYEQAIALLKEGIENDWTREQYLAAVNNKSDSIKFTAYSIRSTFQANQELDADPQRAKNIAQGLLHHFEQDLQLLSPQKTVEPVASTTGHS